ncbi:MAG: septal ring lytic transglycosylase RlpA family protein [Solirubrobacteraceae bacterium]
MSRTLANKTLCTLALALACATCAPTALASTGGASVPAPAAKASTRASQSGHVHAHSSKRTPREQIATWFGPGFYGQQTACGQKMTPAIVGVASRTLPCGTLVLVSYKGHQLTVPVIDRGPYAHNGATWDLTWGAASALSIEDTVRIKTKIVGHAANTPQLGVPAEVQPVDGAAAAPSS